MEKLNSNFIKKFYDKIVVDKYKSNYEYYMWFSNRFNWERYKMNFHTINFHLKNIEFKTRIE
ncbi:MAG: hypothetical protein HRU03_08715 [Nanoarchaeales archaeon]|nr:hypothetical protein [Nanoarchaeales archaeon]